MKRQNIITNAPWEKKVGYSRAVRVGNTIEVSGTVAIRDNEVVGINDPYLQTKRILEIITRNRPSHDNVDILVAIPVQIGKSHSVAFLNIAENT